jgi:cytochrome c-type biogenesis protein CcmH
MMARRALATLATIVACAGLAAPASAQEPQTSLPDIEDEVMCPVCGVTLELATEAPQANQEREFIRERIAAGQSKEEIKDALVAEFGPEVLAIPEAEGFDLAAWLVPGGGIVVAGVAIFVGLRRWRRGGGGGPGEPPAGEALSADEAERLDSDLARYEL